MGGQIFDALVKKDEHYELQPWLATSWEQPDALTWVFHLRDGVRFHDGRPLEAEDVAYTIREYDRWVVDYGEGWEFCGGGSGGGAGPADGGGADEAAGCGVAVQYERWVVWRGAAGVGKGFWVASGGVGAVPVCECGAG